MNDILPRFRVFAVLLALLSVAHAANVPCCNLPDIALAISGAANNEVITLGSGVFAGVCATPMNMGGVAKNLTIIGAGTTILCTNTGSNPAITIFSLLNEGPGDSIIGVTFRTNVRFNSTAIYSLMSSLVLTGVNVTGFEQGITLMGGSMNISDSSLSNNYNDRTTGAAIYAFSALLRIKNTIFNANTAYYGNGGGSGGSIGLTSTRMTLTGSTFTFGYSYYQGGAILANGFDMQISSTTFTSCASPYGEGGAIWMPAGCTATIVNCSFTGLSAGTNGGAIRAPGVSPQLIINSTFTSNTAGGNGVHLYVGNGYGVATVDGCTFTNGIGGYAALLFFDGGTANVVRRSNFTNPIIKNGDGRQGLLYVYGFATVIGSSFNGGSWGIQLAAFAIATITDSYFNGSYTAIQSNAQSASVQRCTFTNSGVFNSGNGGLFFSSGDNVFTDNLFIGNTADYGAISFNTGTLTSNMTRNTFINNYARVGSGAIFIQGGVHTVRDSTFTKNSVVDGNPGIGGAVGITYTYPNLASVTVTGSTFRGNSARNGAAIGISAAGGAPMSMIINNTFYDHINLPSGTGGCIYSAAPLLIRDNTFINSTASLGGAFGVVGGYAVSLINNVFIKTSASFYGGILYSDFGILAVANTTFAFSRAVLGGAIYAEQNGATYVINNCSFIQNSASNGGAAMLVAATITNSVFLNNIASGSGGAIAGNNFVATVSISTSTLSGNSAGLNGGAVATAIQGRVAFNNVTIQGNTAGNYGGGVFTNYVCAGLGMRFSNITGNSAGVAGGGVYVSAVMADGLSNAQDSIISGNTAGSGGGGGFFLDAQIVMLRMTIANNTCVSGNGGGIYSTNDVTITDGSISGNTANQGGGISCHLCNMYLGGALAISGNSATDGGGFWCNIGSQFLPNSTVQFAGNAQTVNPLVSNNCQCGCCALPSTPASINTADCILSSGRSCGYKCDSGYYFANPNKLFACYTNASKPYVVPTPLCLPIPCDPVVPPNNCSATQPEHAVTGDTATFSATLGFTIFGYTQVTCVGPDWVGPRPHCDPNECQPPLTDPPHGYVLNYTAVNGETVDYHCNVGFTRIGASSTTCLPSGGWSNPAPHCLAIGCDILTAPGNGSVQIDAQPATGAVAMFKCDTGYELLGNKSVTCLGGNWSDVSPTCFPQACDTMRSPTNGDVSNPNATTNTYAQFTCHDGFYRVGVASILCFAKVWQGTAPICRPVICNTTAQTDLNSGCPELVAYGTTCTFQCTPGTSGGSPQAQCGQTTDVPTGTFVPTLGLCSPCNAGSFSGEGQTECTACPNGGATPYTRATSQSDCLCAPGYYEATPGAGDCVQCPEGGACSGDKVQPVAASGYYKNADIFSRCSPAVACTGGNLCGTGYGGFACGSCNIGFYRLNGYCYPCPNDGPWRIILLVLGGLVAVRALIEVVKPEAVADRTFGLVSINIALSFLQIVATFSDLRIRWPPATQALYDAFSLVNLNIEIVNPECVAPLDFWDKIEIQLLMPIIVLAMFLFIWAGMVIWHWIRSKRPPFVVLLAYAKKIGKISAAGYMFFMILAYLFLAKAALTVFACNFQGGDVYTLALSPSNLCYTGRWLQVAPLAVFGIIAYIIAVPIAVHAVYLRSRRQFGAAIANNSLFSNFLVAKFREQTWFWENAIMLRKLLMVIVATFGVGDSYGQVAASFAVMLLSLLCSLPTNPYIWRKHNLVENASLFSALGVLFCGLLLSSDAIASQPASVGAIDALAVTSIFLFIIAILACLALEIKVYITVLKLRGRLQPEKVTLLPACNTRMILVTAHRATVVTVSDEGSVRSWHKDTLLPARAFEIKSKMTLATIRGSEIYFVGEQGIVTWNIDLQTWMDTKPVHTAVTAIGNSNDLLITGHEDGSLAFWHFRTPLTEEVPPPNAARASMAINITDAIDGEGVVLQKSFATAMPNIFGVGEGKVVSPAHAGSVTALKAVGLVVYTAGRDGYIRKWSLKTFNCFRQWHVPGGIHVTAIEELPSQLVIGDSSGVLHFVRVDAKNAAHSDGDGLDELSSNVDSNAPMTGVDAPHLASANISTMRLQSQRISALTLCNGMLLSSSEDGLVVVLNGSDRHNSGSGGAAGAEASGRLLQMLPDAEAAVTCLSVLEDGHVVYGDARGNLRRYRINPEWHMKDPDPHLLTQLWEYTKRRYLSKYSYFAKHTSKDDIPLPDAQEDIYDELSVLGESLDLPAIPWRVLDSGSAEAVALALARETQKRRDHSEGAGGQLRRRQAAASSAT